MQSLQTSILQVASIRWKGSVESSILSCPLSLSLSLSSPAEERERERDESSLQKQERKGGERRKLVSVCGGEPRRKERGHTSSRIIWGRTTSVEVLFFCVCACVRVCVCVCIFVTRIDSPTPPHPTPLLFNNIGHPHPLSQGCPFYVCVCVRDATFCASVRMPRLLSIIFISGG